MMVRSYEEKGGDVCRAKDGGKGATRKEQKRQATETTHG